MVAALASGDLALLGRAIDDRIAEPARAPLLPGFAAAKAAALAAGALGCSISGSGPTAFALVADEETGAHGGRGDGGGLRRRGAGLHGTGRRRRPDGSPGGARRMNSRRVDQITIQRCTACSALFPERDPRVRCHCGGLLEVRHLSPALRGEALIRQFDSRRGSQLDADQSGVWRYRELILPSIGTEVVTHPEGNTPLLAREAVSRWCGVADLRLKHEGHNPTGSFKDRGNDGGSDAGAPDRGPGGGLCLDRQYLRRRWPHTPRRRAFPALVFVPAGTGRAGQAGADAGLRRPHPAGPRRLRCLPSPGHGGQRPARRLPAQLDQSLPGRGPEVDRLRDCSTSSAGSLPTGSSCRQATSATPPPSERRWRKRATRA